MISKDLMLRYCEAIEKAAWAADPECFDTHAASIGALMFVASVMARAGLRRDTAKEAADKLSAVLRVLLDKAIEVEEERHRMKKLPVKMQTLAGDGTVVAEKTVNFGVMPPHPDACQTCGRRPAHAPGEPHDAQSLYYQYTFYGEHGRWPTWKDAMAHCSDSMKHAWEHELRAGGRWTEP